MLSRPPHPTGIDSDPASDWIALVSGINIGVACLLGLPCRWIYRIAAVIAYAPAMVFALAVYWFCFQCRLARSLAMNDKIQVNSAVATLPDAPAKTQTQWRDHLC